MSTILQSREVTRTADGAARLAQLAGRFEIAVALVLFAAVQQSLGHHNADNSWLFTVCDKIIDGARPYLDIIETNPPASFLLYMPAALLARILHLRVELVVSACVFAGAICSIAFSRRILVACGMLQRERAGFIANCACFALILTPGFSFAEREHIASIMILPMLAVCAARCEGARVRMSHELVAGLLAGLTMAIKPHFALAIALPIGVVMWRRRSPWPALHVENLIAAAIVVSYACIVIVQFPDFLQVLPSIVAAYVPVKEPWGDLLTEAWFLTNVALLLAVAIAMTRRRFDACVAVAAAASAGFVAAYLLQGKGWVNHGLPGVSLAFIALALSTAPGIVEIANARAGAAWADARRIVMFALAPAALGLPILFGTIIQFTMKEEYPGLTNAVRRFAPAHPKIMTVSGDLDLGHPLVRHVDGEWVGQPHSLWLMLSAQLLLDAGRGDRAQLEGLVARDARMFADNVRERKPDVILVSKGKRVDLMLAHPDIAAVMKNYTPTATVSDISVWTPLIH